MIEQARALSENDIKLKAALERYLASTRRPLVYLRDAAQPWLEENKT